MRQFTTLICFLLFSSCSDDSFLQKNLKAEAIYRKQHETITLSPPLRVTSTKYSWETLSEYPKITKEFFRCKGCSDHLPYTPDSGKELLSDCKGTHGLPLKDGKEFIYPCLIELLNMIQNETGKRVIVTTGHRCQAHNRYADPASENAASKHLIGAEVDFYVEGMENQPLAIIELLQSYYCKTYRNDPSYSDFLRYEKSGCRVTTFPWYNKEIFIKLYLPHEGRDLDNTHPYPYLSIQVRHDRETGERVSYDPKKAQNYLRN